jgi:PAS domain S-box-containing protein
LAVGADDYIAKPVRSHEFLARVKFILRLRDTTVALRSALELNQAMMSGSSVGITAYRASGPCVFANLAAARIAQVPVEELRNSNFRELDWWLDSGLLDMALLTLRTRRVQRDEIKVRWESGREAWLRCHMDSFTSAGELHLLCFTDEITERKRMEDELRRFPGKIIAAQEAERHRVARDLHDSVNQTLASVKMRLRAVAEESAATLSPSAREILSRCGRLLAEALEENRRIAYNLRPGDLDELGLAAACKSLCGELVARTKLKITCGITQSKKRFPPEFELNLFRILQEALNNIENHAAAHNVWVKLGFHARTVALTVVDDGQGFIPGASKPAPAHGLGLANMRERAEALGARCEIVSVPGRGTSISVLASITDSQDTRTGRKQGQKRPVSTQQTA